MNSKLTLLVRLGDLRYLSEVDIRRQVDVPYIGQYVGFIFDQFVVLESSKRVGEAVLFSIVDH